MAEWILIIALAGLTSPSDVQVHRNLTEAQCRGALDALRPLYPRVGATCVGRDGTVIDETRGWR